MGALDLQGIRQRAGRLLGGFSVAQRVGMVGVAVVIVIAVLVFSRWAGRPEMAALFTDLDARDAAAITERLSSQGVRYELAAGGGTIMVPRSKLYDLRLEMTAEGLPSGGSPGWSILDRQGITTSDFSQRVGYQRALEGELARTIASIEAVDVATVHLVIPRNDVFALDNTRATASVMVRTHRNLSLDAGQVHAIVNLVAGSVEGLVPTEVTVADATGRVLAAPGQAIGDAASGDLQVQRTLQYERSVANALEAMLAPVVGPGRAVVTVSAELDFDRSSATSEMFTEPETADGERALVGKTSRVEEYTGPGGQVAGVLGVDGVVEGGEGVTEYRLDESRSDYAVNRVIETTERAPGKLQRLSVAVLLDEGATTPADVAAIAELVETAAGIDAGRGDRVAVSRLAFDTSVADALAAELEAAEAAARREGLLDMLRSVVAGLVVLAVIAVGYISIRRASERRYELEGPVPLPELVMAARADEDPFLGAPAQLEHAEHLPERVEAEALLPPMTEEQRARAELEAEIVDLVERQPDEVAQLLRTWLGDRRVVRR